MQKIILKDLKNITRHLTDGAKIITHGFKIILLISVTVFMFGSKTFADTMNTNVNIRPSMTLSVSTNDINLNLNPATKPFDSKDLTITIGTTTTIGIGSKIDYLKESGTYQLDFKLNAIPTIVQYYMQDLADTTLAQEVCVAEHPTIVIDKRDEQAYTIQRLPDNRCWMLDNLNLDLTSRSIVANMKGTDETGSNTNATSEALGYLKNGGGTTSDQWAIVGLAYENWATSSNYGRPLANKSGTCTTSIQYPCTYNGDYNNNMVLANLTPNQSTFGNGYGKIGIFYNYCAASAGSYCYSNGSPGDAGAPSGNATNDICPSAWRLPTGGQNGEYDILCTAINGDAPCATSQTMSGSSATSMQYILSTPLTGYYQDNGHRQGTYGGFWTSTYSASDNLMNRFVAQATWVEPRMSHQRSAGNSIRCILK